MQDRENARQMKCLLLTFALATAPVLSSAGCEQAAAPSAPAPPTGTPDQRGVSEDGTPVLVNPNRRAMLSEPAESATLALGTSADASGRITMQMWHCQNSVRASHNAVACDVDSDYVLTGGGAWAEWTGPGALLTAAYPADSNLIRWEARSKDHVHVDQHILHSFAIGIKLSGISRSTLLSNMRRVTNTSSQSEMPVAQADLPDGFTTLGGGAKVTTTGAGSLLMTSYPWRCPNGDRNSGVCHSWIAGAHDLIVSSPATITTYVIGIRPTIPNFGTLRISAPFKTASQVSTGVASVTNRADPGWVITGYGVLETTGGTNQGRFPFRIGPSDGFPNDETLTQSKDHIHAHNSILSSKFIQISRQ